MDGDVARGCAICAGVCWEIFAWTEALLKYKLTKCPNLQFYD